LKQVLPYSENYEYPPEPSKPYFQNKKYHSEPSKPYFQNRKYPPEPSKPYFQNTKCPPEPSKPYFFLSFPRSSLGRHKNRILIWERDIYCKLLKND